MALEKPHIHPGSLGLFHCITKLLVRFHIGPHFFDALHLDNEGKYCMVSFFLSLDKLMYMLYSTLCGSIREIADTRALKSAALHFHQILLNFAP